jgi:hypothetical protein
MLQKMYAVIKNSIKMQYTIALTAMWTGGFAICIYLVGFSAKSDVANELLFLDIGKAVPDSLNENYAYVFVNVNEKHFLTRFVAAVTDQEETDKKKNDAINISNPIRVEKIIKKYIPAPEKKAADFSIKPAPEL